MRPLCVARVLRFRPREGLVSRGPESRPRRASVSARNRERGVRRRIPGAFLHRAAATHLFRRMMGPRAGAGREIAQTQLREQVPSGAGRGHWGAHFAAGGEMPCAKCRTRKRPPLEPRYGVGKCAGRFSLRARAKIGPGRRGFGPEMVWEMRAKGEAPKTSTAREKLLIT